MEKPKQNAVASPSPVVNKMASQVIAIIGLSVVLGMSFNASNPIGIHWATQPNTAETAAANSPSSASAPNAGSQSQQPSINSLGNGTPPLPQVSVQNGSPNPAVASPVNPSPATVPAQSGAVSTPMSWVEAKPLVSAGQVVLIDARPKPSYEAGHIPGAISFPESSSPEEFANFRKQYGTNTQLVVYCASASCSLSKRLADKLVQEFGYTSVRYITGGYQEWQRAEGLAVAPPEPITPPPVVSAPTISVVPPAPVAVVPTNAAAPAVPAVMPTAVTWAEAKPLVNAGQVVLVDARAGALYEAGHIPGAISLPESSTPEEIFAFQKKFGPTAQLIVYCGSQSCSLSRRLAEKLTQQFGFPSVRYMTGGYQEWQQAELSGRKSGP
jgi:rhodanese-related sulfurtransferase